MGLCGGIKIVALGIFMADWWLVRRRRHLETAPPLDPHKDIAGSIISLDKRTSNFYLVPQNIMRLNITYKAFVYSFRRTSICGQRKWLPLGSDIRREFGDHDPARAARRRGRRTRHARAPSAHRVAVLAGLTDAPLRQELAGASRVASPAQRL